jgi:hypothetical protein
MSKEAIVAWSVVLSWNLAGGTDQTTKTPWITRTEISTRVSRTRSRNWNHSISTFVRRMKLTDHSVLMPWVRMGEAKNPVLHAPLWRTASSSLRTKLRTRKVHCCVNKSLSANRIISRFSRVHTFTAFPVTSSLITPSLCSAPRSCKWTHPLWFTNQNILWISHFFLPFYMLHAPCFSCFRSSSILVNKTKVLILNCVSVTCGPLCYLRLHNLAHSRAVTCQVVSLQIKNMKPSPNCSGN